MSDSMEIIRLRVLLAFYQMDEESRSVMNISRMLGQEHYVISRVISGLEKEGLIERETPRKPVLTAKGKEKAEKYSKRMFCLQSHYRKPLEFSYEIMDNTKAAYNKLVKRVAGLKKEGEVDQNVFAEYKAKFVDAISNDLNTSMAITVLYDLLKADTNDITKYELIRASHG